MQSNTPQLHQYIADCDSVLETYEGILCSFEQNLTQLSNEIKGLNDKAKSFQTLAKNRHQAEELLAGYIESGRFKPFSVFVCGSAPAFRSFFFSIFL